MNKPYSYVVLRYVHDTTSCEFVNVGVLVYSAQERYAKAKCRNTAGRITTLFPGSDGKIFKSIMRALQQQIEKIGEKMAHDLPLEELPKTVTDLAQTILPKDDSSLQWSAPGGGVTENLDEALESLFDRHVSRYDEKTEGATRTDEAVWTKFRRALEARQVLKKFERKTISCKDDEIEFQHAWKNGVWHCLEPVSLDLRSADSIKAKAHRWLGQVLSLEGNSDAFKLYFLLGEPTGQELRPAFDQAVSILKRKLSPSHEIYTEEQAEEFGERIAQQVASQALHQ